MILKTYTRIFTTNLPSTLATLGPLHANAPHLKFEFGAWTLVGLGDLLIVAGANEASFAPIRQSLGPWIVDDLQATRTHLLAQKATITHEIESSSTGLFLYAQHADGTVVEYVQWNSDLLEKFIEIPRREGRLASQL
jgi:hypothetical protein